MRAVVTRGTPPELLVPLLTTTVFSLFHFSYRISRRRGAGRLWTGTPTSIPQTRTRGRGRTPRAPRARREPTGAWRRRSGPGRSGSRSRRGRRSCGPRRWRRSWCVRHSAAAGWAAPGGAPFLPLLLLSSCPFLCSVFLAVAEGVVSLHTQPPPRGCCVFPQASGVYDGKDGRDVRDPPPEPPTHPPTTRTLYPPTPAHKTLDPSQILTRPRARTRVPRPSQKRALAQWERAQQEKDLMRPSRGGGYGPGSGAAFPPPAAAKPPGSSAGAAGAGGGGGAKRDNPVPTVPRASPRRLNDPPRGSCVVSAAACPLLSLAPRKLVPAKHWQCDAASGSRVFA